MKIIIILCLITILYAQTITNKWNKDQFDQLCSTKHPDDFAALINNFKEIYVEPCLNGTYYGWNGKNIVCMNCVKGNYIRDDYICCNCGIGAISTEDNSKQCTECPQKYGANEDNTKCVICPLGTYSNSKGSGCISCGIGKYTKHEGSTYCVECPIGQGVNSQGNGCEKCGLGYYSPSIGSGCLKCHNGSISTTIGSTECQPCPVGQGANKERTKCEKCLIGMYAPEEGSGCNFCPSSSGFGNSVGSTECQDCAARRFFLIDPWFSLDEEGNYYWDDKGKYSYIFCSQCLKGTYGPGEGMGCPKCTKGSIAQIVGTAVCTNCTKGYGENEEITVCERCTACQI